MNGLSMQKRRGLSLVLSLVFLLSAVLVFAPGAKALMVTGPGNSTHTEGDIYSQNVSYNSAAPGTVSFAFNAGSSHPAGFTINSSGLIQGMFPITGVSTTYNVIVDVTDSSLIPVTHSFVLTVNAAPPLTLPGAPLSFSSGTVGTPYSDSAFGIESGAVGAVTYTMQNPPPGLSIHPTTGAITGIPTTAGSYNSVVIHVRDSLGSGRTAQSVASTIVINPGLYLPPATMPNGKINSAYSFTPPVMGATSTTTFSLTGSVPPGIDIDPATGRIHGTPTNIGNWNVVIKAEDGVLTSTQSYTLTITADGSTTPPPAGYTITSGNSSNYSGSGSLSVVSNAPYSKFVRVTVNGKTLSSSNYIASSGSTVITFTESYMRSLSAGSYSFSIVSSDGSASGNFYVGRNDPGYRPPSRPPVPAPNPPSRRPVVVSEGGSGSSSSKAPTVIMKVEVEEATVEWTVMD